MNVDSRGDSNEQAAPDHLDVPWCARRPHGRGLGRADLFRDLVAVPLGTEFDIHFRVIDAATSAVVLQSGCYQFVVSR